MCFDLFNAVCAKACRSISLYQLADKVLQLLTHINFMQLRVREDNLAASDLDAKHVVARILEWYPASCHLIDYDSQSPPVNFIAVTFAVEHFR